MFSHSIAAVIMAAGKGKRMMNPETPKVMYTIGGKPMIEHVVACAKQFQVYRIIVIVGHQKEKVISHLNNLDPTIETAIQAEQLGTGHAIMQTESALKKFSGDVVILSGDVPLLRASTVTQLIDHHRQTNAAVTVLTTRLSNPSGYGRIVRAFDNSIVKIVEQKDASEDELKINEINSGIYVFQKEPLFDALKRITPNNAQGEYYLTDVVKIFSQQGLSMEPLEVESIDEIRGVNTKEQLEEMEQLYQARFQTSV